MVWKEVYYRSGGYGLRPNRPYGLCPEGESKHALGEFFNCKQLLVAGGGGSEALEDAVRDGAGLVFHKEVGAAFVLQGAATVVGVAAHGCSTGRRAADRDFFSFFGAESVQRL